LLNTLQFLINYLDKDYGMDTINLTIQYSHEDLQASYMLYYSHYYPVRSRLLLILGISIFALSVLMLVISHGGFMDDPIYEYPGWFLLFYGIAVIAFHLWRMKTLGRRLFKKMPEFHSPYNITFSNKGIVTKGALISSDVNWSYYTDTAITPELILLFHSKLKFNMYPKRFFSDDEFRQLAVWAQGIRAEH
jgi:hypothetical protein